jgi:hypothetical protein
MFLLIIIIILQFYLALSISMAIDNTHQFAWIHNDERRLEMLSENKTTVQNIEI